MVHRFGGYHLGCASGSWSDLSRAIVRNHFLNVCPGSCHDRVLYSMACGYSFYHRFCLSVVEDHSDSAAFVFGIHLVSPFVHFSLSAIECDRHGVCHGGLTNYRIVRTVVRWLGCIYVHFCENVRRKVWIVANVGSI
jgi:hypothetical protein